MRARILAWTGLVAAATVAGLLAVSSPAAAGSPAAGLPAGGGQPVTPPRGRLTLHEYAGLRGTPAAGDADNKHDLA
ncbi:hypothetical protein AB0F81_49585, partial [Actinoplanes sp. NPDC024001]|uniref:hypothetical protein n=1 Tax=Actinoplanes sp. NPDC024001 TaxID=3154598 RepID=UPI003408B4D7